MYLPADLDEAVRASGRNLPDLIRLGLEHAEQTRGDRLAAAVERLLVKLQAGYSFVPPADDKAAVATELAALAERMNKLAGQIGP